MPRNKRDETAHPKASPLTWVNFLRMVRLLAAIWCLYISGLVVWVSLRGEPVAPGMLAVILSYTLAGSYFVLRPMMRQPEGEALKLLRELLELERGNDPGCIGGYAGKGVADFKRRVQDLVAAADRP